ncbi:hypothetical protein [Winogradskyella haliclonae]|uniref:Uncharacterized protein n=1 Tax=Winogradskyella haliclonae TaxID=2048558 RepID=A0ABQ2C165_9FLAO|nr:hypothetical protein [Winogradskyella haliclonae]GGI56873.1 hypothetical protein GCM10011444_11820 [Winogradskyella haliclonae]
MKLSENNKKTLLVSIHQSIEENASHTVNDLERKRINRLINYPSNGGLTESEKTELEKLEINPTLKSALRKVFASNTADVFFSFLNIVDGTTDPNIEFGEWEEVMLVDFDEENEMDSMLHDDFYGTYWDWKEKRPNPGWKLDLLDE